MKKLLILIIFLFQILVSYSQNFSLSDCIDYAYENRIELQKQENASSYYHKNFTYSKYGLLPTFNSKTNYQFSSNRDNKISESGTFDLNGELVLFNGFQSINNIKQSKLLVARNNTYTEKLKNEIKIQIIESFYGVLVTKENINIGENSIKSTTQQILLITEAVNAGKTSEIDLLEMKAQLEKNKSAYATAIKQYEQASIKLRKMMNYRENQILSVNASKEISTKDSVSLDVDLVYKQSLSTLPEIQLSKQDSLSANYDLRRIKGKYSPYLSLWGSISSQYQESVNLNFGNQLNNNLSELIGISLTIPIYSKHEIKKQQVEKETQIKDLTLDNQQLYKDIYFEIERICKEAIQDKNNVESLKKRFEYYSKIYEIRKIQYYHGVLSITDLLIAENNTINAELEYIYEKYNLQYNLTLIDFYCGKI